MDTTMAGWCLNSLSDADGIICWGKFVGDVKPQEWIYISLRILLYMAYMHGVKARNDDGQAMFC